MNIEKVLNNCRPNHATREIFQQISELVIQTSGVHFRRSDSLMGLTPVAKPRIELLELILISISWQAQE